MANQSKLGRQVFGLLLLVIGVGLVYWGYDLSGSLASQLTKSLSGTTPDEVMFRYIGGAACGVVGLFLLLKR